MHSLIKGISSARSSRLTRGRTLVQPAYHPDGGHPFLECTARGPSGTVLTALASKSRSLSWREAGPAKQQDAGALGQDPGAGA